MILKRVIWGGRAEKFYQSLYAESRRGESRKGISDVQMTAKFTERLGKDNNHGGSKGIGRLRGPETLPMQQRGGRTWRKLGTWVKGGTCGKTLWSNHRHRSPDKSQPRRVLSVVVSGFFTRRCSSVTRGRKCRQREEGKSAAQRRRSAAEKTRRDPRRYCDRKDPARKGI